MSLLECQHEEKASWYKTLYLTLLTEFLLQPSIQKLVTKLTQDCLPYIDEEAIHTDAYSLPSVRLNNALEALESEFSESFITSRLLDSATSKSVVRVAKREAIYQATVRWSSLVFW